MTRQQIIARLRKGDALIDAHTHLGADLALYANGDYPYAMSAEDHGVRLAHTGIGAALCFPWIYTNYFALAAFRRGRFRRDPGGDSPHPYAFENERLCREVYQAFPETAGRLLPFAFFDPLRRTREQAAGIRDLAARFPLFGLNTRCRTRCQVVFTQAGWWGARRTGWHPSLPSAGRWVKARRRSVLSDRLFLRCKNRWCRRRSPRQAHLASCYTHHPNYYR